MGVTLTLSVRSRAEDPGLKLPRRGDQLPKFRDFGLLLVFLTSRLGLRTFVVCYYNQFAFFMTVRGVRESLELIWKHMASSTGIHNTKPDGPISNKLP